MLTLLLQLAAVALAIGLAVHFLRPRYNLRIVVRRGQVDVDGRALDAYRAVVGDFFRHELPDVHQARVEGYWDGRRLRLRFRGDLGPGQRQRVRNFLVATL